MNLDNSSIKKAAFFYTCSADAKHTTIPDMEKQLGKAPVATLGIETGTINDTTFNKKLEAFVKNVK